MYTICTGGNFVYILEFKENNVKEVLYTFFCFFYKNIVLGGGKCYIFMDPGFELFIAVLLT
jgi:hypothetical protein